MHIFRNPKWIKKFLFKYDSFEAISEEEINRINKKLIEFNDKPVISVVIPAFNEELNLLSCIASIAENISEVPFEIIVVNNNSTDNTQKLLDKLKVKCFFESKVGPGAARQLGQERALGEYILTADADCIYPFQWINTMYKALKTKGTACVYGRYSFLGTDKTPRWQLFIYERFKDILSELRHLKRPYLNSLGMSMGYPKKLGLKIGYDTRNIILEDGSISFVRGEDGRMCFDLSQIGDVRQVRTSKARLWTFQRTLEKDGSLWNSFRIRIKKEIAKLFTYLRSHPPHDTKQSVN